MEKFILTGKFKTKSEMAKDLGISLSTLQRRLKQVQIALPRGLLSPKQQAFIIQQLNQERNEKHLN